MAKDIAEQLRKIECIREDMDSIQHGAKALEWFLHFAFGREADQVLQVSIKMTADCTTNVDVAAHYIREVISKRLQDILDEAMELAEDDLNKLDTLSK